MEKVHHLWIQGRLAQWEQSCLVYDSQPAKVWMVRVSEGKEQEGEMKSCLTDIYILMYRKSDLCLFTDYSQPNINRPNQIIFLPW